jgi:hypothetical protein
MRVFERAAGAAVVVASLLALGPAAAHAGVTFHAGQANVGQHLVDPGAASGESVVLDFESQTTPKGFTRIDGAPETFGFFQGDGNGIAAEPDGDASQYFYVGTGGSETFLFDKGVSSTSFYWGSVDDYNAVDVLGGSRDAPSVLQTITAFDATGYQGRHFGQSLRLYIDDSTAGGILGLRFRSAGQSFEIDNVAVSYAGSQTHGTPGPAPEPAGWAMMIFGISGLGAAMRRRRQAGVLSTGGI